MNRYTVRFRKDGYIRYTSHLDMLRLFKRAFKRAGVPLVYSQGFNPHPKMGFAQPLSLGYTSCCELLEFETTVPQDTEAVKKALEGIMPAGIDILSVTSLDAPVKSLAAVVTEAVYRVVFPAESERQQFQTVLDGYLAQEQIMAQKRQKKTKKMVASDIRPKIRSIVLEKENPLTLRMNLDSGSTSNLSPEQVIVSFTEYAGLDIRRCDVEVERLELIFDEKYRKYLQF